MKKIAILVYIIFIISGCSGNKKEFTAESIEVEMAKNPTSLGDRNIFYIDPLTGDIDNDGSIDSPWDTLEHVLKKGYVKTKSYNGNVRNESGVIEAGDIVKLRTGHHGKIYYRNSYNEQPIVFEADEGHKPTLSRLRIHSAENLVFKGLTISPTFDENDFGGGSIVLFCSNKWFGVCNNITLMDSFIYSSLDVSSWNRDDWLTKSSSGISVSRGSTNFKFINNYILNVENGITVSSPGTLIDNNVVSGYFKNGLNVNSDQTVVTKNVVKNSLGIRAGGTFGMRGYNGASGIKNVAIQDNIFLSDYNNVSNFSNEGNGIVFYDGPIDSFFIDNNVVGVGWNGIVLYDSMSSEIKNNVVYNLEEDDTGVVASLKLGSKGRLVPNENVIEGNGVNKFSVSIDANVTDIFNNDVSINGFNSKFSDVANTIFNSYGNEHLVSQLQKIDSGVTDTHLVSSKSTDTNTSTAVGSNYILSATIDPVLITAKAEPSIFYVDPVSGNIENAGSKSSPWSTLEAVLNKGYIETKDKNGVVRYSGAPVKAGDIIKLKSGYHGEIYYRNSYNDELITIEADEGETPELSRLEVHSATNILFKGLTISPSFSSSTSSRGSMVKFCTNDWFGECDNISIVDSYIYTVDDASAWSKEDWDSNVSVAGIAIGKNGTQFNIINNMIRNVNFGIIISSPNSHVSGNIISHYAADGIRVGANNSTVQFNVIKNNLNVNANHDDGIQGYQGIIGGNDDLIINNIIISSDVERPAFPGPLQGIGYFDGLSSRLSVIGNAIDVDAYHGISLYDVEASVIAENVTITTEPLDNGAACWIMIGTKGKIGSTGNEVISNYSNSFKLSDNIEGVNENNLTVSLVDYADKFTRILNEINLRYGAGSSLANLPRVSDFYKNKIGAN